MIVASVAAFADDSVATTTFDKPLTISGLAAGDKVNFYKIVEWVGDEAQPAGSVVVSGWKVVDHYKGVLTEDAFKAAFVGTPATTEPVAAAVAPTGITAEMAGNLARLAATDTTASTEVTVETAGTAVLNNDAAGMWMALITPSDVDTMYNPVFVGADFNKDKTGDWKVTEAASYGDSAVAKKSTTDLNKEASNEGDVAPDDLKWTTTAVGDILDFTVTTTIPGYGDVYQAPFFKLTDKLNDLELVDNTIQITAPSVPAGKATITPASDKKSYTIEFDSDYLKTIKTPTTLTVTYKAKVTTTAPVHVNWEKNEVWTEFSHDPTKESDHAFKKDDTIHYTFTLDAEGLGGGSTQSGKKTSELVKIGQNADGTPITEETKYSEISEREYWEGPLAGAKFKLYRKNVVGTLSEEYTPSNGEIVSGADGRFTIAGLDAGTYYLQESEAPAGFVRDLSIHTIVIDAVLTPKDVTEYTTDGKTWISAEAYDKLDAEAKKEYKSYTYKVDTLDTYTVKVDGEDTATYHFTNKGTDAEIVWTETPPVEHPFDIINTKGVELPSTGGMGTTILYVGGSILVLAAVILLITKRRMNAED